MGCGASSRPQKPGQSQHSSDQSTALLEYGSALDTDLCVSEICSNSSGSDAPVRPSRNKRLTVTHGLRRGETDPTLAGNRSLRRAQIVIREGRPKVAKSPVTALEAFFKSAVGEDIPSNCKTLMRKKLRDSETEYKRTLKESGNSNLRAAASMDMETSYPLAPVHTLIHGAPVRSITEESLGRTSMDSMSTADGANFFERQPLIEEEALGSKDAEEIKDALEQGKVPVLRTLEARAWLSFSRWCHEQLLLELWVYMDRDGHGFITAGELMTVLVIIAVREDMGASLCDPTDAELTLQEFDISGNGTLSCEDFLHMAQQLEREFELADDDTEVAYPSIGEKSLPHLLLNFDVNNTILITDSCTGQAAKDLISTTLAGRSWGISVHDGTLWLLVCPEPREQPPWKGLISYSEFVNQAHPIPECAKKPEIRAVKDRRRLCLKSFCDPDQPGESLRPYCEKLLGCLELKEELRGTEAAIAAGLDGNSVRILPSFFVLLHKLKKAGRTFSIVFRTFGTDLNDAFEREFNAFCEGRHPLFLDGPVFDGSDGGDDHRMDLSDTRLMGTFVRGMNDDSLSLVWGTHQQPEPQEGGISWYIDGTGRDDDYEIVQGAEEVAQNLEAKILESSKTIAIRDFYDSWAAARFRGKGGKPLFLTLEDHDCFAVFFDDALRPTDPTIIDPIDARDYPVRVPMAQVFNIHLKTASPLSAISEPSYFWDALVQCEEAKRAQRQRRRKVGRVLHSVKGLRAAIEVFCGVDDKEQDWDGVETTGGLSMDMVDHLTVSRRLSQGSAPRTSSSKVGASRSLHFTKWAEREEVMRFAPLAPDAEDRPEKVEARVAFRAIASMTVAPSSKEMLPSISLTGARLTPNVTKHIRGSVCSPRTSLEHGSLRT